MRISFLVLFLSILVSSCVSQSTPKTQSINSTNTPVLLSAPDTTERIRKTDAAWKAQLSEKGYYVMREKGTERAFSGKLWDFKGDGAFVCAACANPLFSSETKFKSGTGWPSFYDVIQQGRVRSITDRSFGMTRIEVVCNRCEAHLGHVFSDGPAPTGQRYCINSASLDFVEGKSSSKDAKKKE